MKVKVYTDGSCINNPGAGGWAVVFNTEYSYTHICGGEKYTTNNRMELRAVIEAFKEINSMHLLNNDKVLEFELFCDSAYVVNSINNGWIEKWLVNDWKTTKGESVKNKDLWMEVHKAKSVLDKNGVKIRLIKIKGHAGNLYNELVDKLAKGQSKKAEEGE